MNYKNLICLIALMTVALVSSALNLPVKIIGGKPYYYYTVDKKDRFYELPKKTGAPRSVILSYNPAAADGIQAGMVLTIPVEYDAVIINNYYTIRYKPQKAESIYGISKRFDIPVDKIIEFNPSASQGIRGDLLIIPLAKADISENPDITGSLNDGFPYSIRNGETLSSIAINNNIKLNELLAVNPRLDPDNYTEGTVIIIPEKQIEVQPVPLEPAPAETAEKEPAENGNQPVFESGVISTQPVNPEVSLVEPIGENTDSIAQEQAEAKPAVISLLLPFGLGETEANKNSSLITEFYQGFLMGAEELSHKGSPVIIRAFDSAVSPDSLNRLLANPMLTESDIIIGPDNEESIQKLTANIKGTGTRIFNPFVVKSNAYLTNTPIIQAIIPHELMYEKAVDAFVESLNGKVPVFLSRIQGPADKTPFVTLLKDRLSADTISFKEIAYRDFLTAENLEELTADNQYAFIPASGNRIEFNKFAHALKTLKEKGIFFELFGFPEWVTFRNETLESMHQLNTTIYTRFYIIPDDPAALALENKFKGWFGHTMTDAIPNQGIFGYDIANYLINSLRSPDPIRWQGVQSGFSFSKASENGGEVNGNLYLMTFLPDGTTVKTIL